jgi:hypothetical protein
MSGCCNEYGCKRKQPFHIMRGDFSGKWSVVTKWKERSGGGFVADEKHELPENYERQLNEAFPVSLWQTIEDDE